MRPHLAARERPAAHEVRDPEAREGGAEPDHEHLEATPPGVADRDAGLVPPDDEQRRRAHEHRDDDSEDDVVLRDEERREGDQGPHDRGDANEDGALPRLTRVHRGEVELMGHHDLEPCLRLRRDLVHHFLEFFAVEVPALEDLADLLPFEVREFDHLPALPFHLRGVVVPPGDRRRVGDRAHGDGLGEGRREAARQDDGDRVRVPVGGDRDPHDDPEDVHEPVLAPQDEVGEEAGLRVFLRERVLVDAAPEREPRCHHAVLRRCERPLGYDGFRSGSAEEGFSPLRRWAARMSAPLVPPWSVSLGGAIRSTDPEAALRAGLAAVDAKAAPLEIVRAAALTYGETIGVGTREPLRGMMALSAAVRIARNLSPRVKALPVLRAVALAAADPKVPSSERRRRLKVSGEISHLTRSFEYAVRTGAFEDAVSIFSGLLFEGKERVMAGGILFPVP